MAGREGKTQEKLGQTIEVRLAQWLLDRILQTEANPKLQEFASELERRTNQWQFQRMEPDGTVSLTRQIDKNQVSEAENQWLQSNQELVQRYMDAAGMDETPLRGKIRELGLDEREENELGQGPSTVIETIFLQSTI